MTYQENRAQISRYIEAAGYLPEDTVSIVWKTRSGRLNWTHVEATAAPAIIDGHLLVDTWISACPMRPPADPESRGTTDDVYAVRALWADLDVKPGGMPTWKAARTVISEVSGLIGAMPTTIVMSGHGLQPRWRLEQTGLADPDEATADMLERFGRLVQLVATRHGGKADSVHDLPRLLRAPGTRNNKDGINHAIPTEVRFFESGVVDIEHLLETLDEYVPLARTDKPAGEPFRPVELQRGDRYVQGAVAAIRKELASIADWPLGQTDERGRGWEKITADTAFRLASLAKAEWNSLAERPARDIYADACPTDAGWTIRDLAKKWNAQWKRAEPAEPPATNDDPLSDGYVGGADASPHPQPPAGGAEGDLGRSGASADPVDRSGAGDDPGVRADAPGWRKYTWDDFGNAERTVALHGDVLRYAPSTRRWYFHTDGAWQESENGGERAVQDMIRALPRLESDLYSEAEYRKGRETTSDRVEFGKWWEQQKTASKVRAAAQVVRNDGMLDIDPTVFDSEPMLLNARNGVIDLYSGELLPHDPALMMSRQLPTRFDPEAKAELWEKFLERVMPDAETRAYLQRIIGYSITGDTGEQAIFIHQGPPASGKSVFLRVTDAMLGPFSRIVPPASLLTKRLDAHPTDIAGMEGRRMLQVSETPQGARLDEALIKRLSGEERITARLMGQDFHDFRMKGKVHIATNHLPHITADPATKRRLHLLGWNVVIPIEERNKSLGDHIIRTELEGVLAWAVRGAMDWRRSGLQVPLDMAAAVEEWVSTEDELGEFLLEELVIDEKALMPTKQLFIRYAQYCESMRQKPMSKVQFGRELSARGIPAGRTMSTRGWKVRLRYQLTELPDPLA